MAPLVRTGGSRHTGLAALPHRNIQVEHLNLVDDEAQERMNILVRQMLEKQGITEEMKVRDQMEWVRAVNNIRNVAEEIVLKELIYR